MVDRKIAKGEKLRPLEGLPVSIKGGLFVPIFFLLNKTLRLLQIVWNKKAVMPLVDWLPKRFNRMPKMVCWSSLCAMLAPFLLFAVRRLVCRAIHAQTGNVPQALMLPESHNWVWGRTDNPYNAQR